MERKLNGLFRLAGTPAEISGTRWTSHVSARFRTFPLLSLDLNSASSDEAAFLYTSEIEKLDGDATAAVNVLLSGDLFVVDSSESKRPRERRRRAGVKRGGRISLKTRVDFWRSQLSSGSSGDHVAEAIRS